jgi:hypothetical protein
MYCRRDTNLSTLISLQSSSRHTLSLVREGAKMTDPAIMAAARLILIAILGLGLLAAVEYYHMSAARERQRKRRDKDKDK